jgi:hypothetical protein
VYCSDPVHFFNSYREAILKAPRYNSGSLNICELAGGRFDEMSIDNTEGGPRVDAFLHGGSSLWDFILLGRRSQVSAVLGKHASKLRHEDLGRFDNERDRMAALVKFMDAVTNSKMIREAEVYRPILVDCE